MAKVAADSSTTSARASVAMITHTTYLGHSQLLEAAAFLDRVMPPLILFRFADEKPQKIAWADYEQLVNGLADFEKKVDEAVSSNSQIVKAIELPGDVSAVFLESQRVKLRWQQRNLVFTAAELAQIVTVLVATHAKAKPLVRRMLEKAELLKKPGLLTALTNWGGFAIFLLLTMVDTLLLVSMLFQPKLYFPWTVLTTFLAAWLLLLRPPWSYKILPALLDYLNEQFLADLSNLRLPRKSVEFFLIIGMGIVYLLCFGSEAANYIFDFWKGSFSP
ncbi:MAG: hypothetical protein CVV42_07745 [Candidatus Riflebacteria bacterium HGW-Riflebacteria-2]|jgi:hypothetical protein|nr:MAG: hypothetical protein CVV42_07745 [Candidatus Riflebacteria bacterium HGW-Riflebacteria-2]